MEVAEAVISSLDTYYKDILKNDAQLEERVIRFANSWTVNDPQFFDMVVKSTRKQVIEIIEEKHGKQNKISKKRS